MEEDFRFLYSRPTTLAFKDGNVVPNVDGSAIFVTCLESYVRNYVTNVGCVAGAKLDMTSTFVFDDAGGNRRYANIYAGIYNLEDFRQIIANPSTNPVVTLSIMRYLRNAERFTWHNPRAIPGLKQHFRECPGDQYFYIPLTLHPIQQPGTVPIMTAHANGILLSKAKGTVMRIEPTVRQEGSGLDTKLDEAVIRVANEIGLKDPRLIQFEDTCPQAITRDINCIFWSLYLFKTVLENLNKDPNAVVKELSLKPKAELDSIIANFILELKNKIIPQSLAKEGIIWEDFNTFLARYPRGGKNGNRKSIRRRKRKHGSKKHKTSKAKQ